MAETPQGTDAGRAREAARVRRAQEAMAPGCEGWAYMVGRGFTGDEIREFGIGWEPSSSYKGDDGARLPCGRVVVPFPGVPWYHIDRALAEGARDKYIKPRAEDVGPQPPFATPGAYDAEVVFVVEGALDALAVQACGFPAIAVCGTSWDGVEGELSGRGFAGTVACMLDFDEPGRKANGALLDRLIEDGVAAYSVGRLPGGAKDACDALTRDAEALEEQLSMEARGAARQAEAEAASRYDDDMEGLGARDPADVAMGILTLADADEPVPTGLKGLDDAIGGGLHRGLAVLGALSSMGKTTLALQISDNIAASGRRVLFVTIEQSAQELVAKSICRKLWDQEGIEAGPRDILSRARRNAMGTEDAIQRAAAAYSASVAHRLRIMEGSGRPTAKSIRKAAERMAAAGGEPPVVFVDYLQLIAPDDPRDSDKRALDASVTAMRQLARDLKTQVVVISSFNRQSYKETAGLGSFKESGGIEYGADLLVALQPSLMEKRIGDDADDKKRAFKAQQVVNETKAEAVRAIEAVILKNRNGETPAEGVQLVFRAKCCHFSCAKWQPEKRAPRMLEPAELTIG